MPTDRLPRSTKNRTGRGISGVVQLDSGAEARRAAVSTILVGYLVGQVGDRPSGSYSRQVSTGRMRASTRRPSSMCRRPKVPCGWRRRSVRCRAPSPPLVLRARVPAFRVRPTRPRPGRRCCRGPPAQGRNRIARPARSMCRRRPRARSDPLAASTLPQQGGTDAIGAVRACQPGQLFSPWPVWLLAPGLIVHSGQIVSTRS